MDVLNRLTHFDPLDVAALVVLFGAWNGIGWRVEHPAPGRPSMSIIMAGYRLEWMRQMVTRDSRIFDAQILATLRQGTAFFASTSVIAIGGTLALIGNAERLAGVAEDVIFVRQPAIVWELKLLVLTFFATNAFLKFVWSNRLFGYCGVLIAAVPNDPADPVGFRRAEQAGHINIAAARSFNRGLRSIYFALATVAWLAGAVPLIGAAILTVVVIWRREFASQSRKVLIAE